MSALQIVTIDLKMPVNIFEQELQDSISNHSSHMSYELKPMSTRQGKTMYKLIVDNGDNSDFTMIAERDDSRGEILFHPMKLSNMGESFYGYNYDDDDIIGSSEDPCMFFCTTMDDLCKKNHGDFAYVSPLGNPSIIKDGKWRKTEAFGLVDENGTVYSCAGAKTVRGASDAVDFTVKKPIGDWLAENTDVQVEVAKLPGLNDKMNYIGKYLINARIKDEIEAEEFMDIFRQAGVLGFSEPSVLNIYKLIM